MLFTFSSFQIIEIFIDRGQGHTGPHLILCLMSNQAHIAFWQPLWFFSIQSFLHLDDNNILWKMHILAGTPLKMLARGGKAHHQLLQLS